MIGKTDIVLVTGASGFIASWIVKELLSLGVKVRGTVRDPKNERKVKHLTQLPGAAENLELVALDLNRDDQFDEVVKGVTLIAHTASPFPNAAPKDENELIKPAVNGALGIMKAAAKCSTVRAVVLTSSVVSVGSGTALIGEPTKMLGEADWTKVEKAQPYDKSKTLAERAAWDFWNEAGKPFTFCTINPSFVMGPMLSQEVGTSTELLQRMLDEKLPMLPRVSFASVDVRDVAHAHVRALQLSAEEANGRRFIVSNDSFWLTELAACLKKGFEPLGYRIGTRTAPCPALWIASFFDKGLAMVLPTVGLFPEYDNTPSKEILKITYTDMDKSMADAGHAAIYWGISKKKRGYKQPSADWTPVKAGLY
jgi:nucleoside-diphosphate-sugar epimerase